MNLLKSCLPRHFWPFVSMVVILTLGLGASLHGQEKRTVLSFSGGLNFADSQDLLISSLSHLGKSGGGILSYRYIDSSQYHFVRMDGGFGRPFLNDALATNLPGVGTDWKLEINLSYGSLFSVHYGRFYNLFLGFGLEENFNVWLIDSFRAYSLANSVTLGGQFAFIHEKNNRQLRLLYYLPLIGISTKPYYNTYDAELVEIVEGNTEILNSIFNLNEGTRTLFSWYDAFNMVVRLEYEWKFRKSIGLFMRCQASLFYNRHQIDNKITNSYDFFSGLSLYL